MPSLHISDLKLLKDDYSKYPCFIETGTLEGNTILAMDNYFSVLYTIEYSEKYYNYTKNKYNGNKINFILGDSSIVFEELLPHIKNKTIFFLDGHWSGGDTGKSSKDCPLIEEVTSINNLFVNEGIIIIDDFRLFGLNKSSGKLNEDWSEISKDKILNILQDRVTNVYHFDSICSKDDRLVIHIKSK